jgi:DNA anti-recombination protein RmuC
VTALVEGQIALAAGIDRLAETMAESRRQTAAIQDAQSDGIDRVAARLETLVARLEDGLAPALRRLSEETALTGRETRTALEAEAARRRQDAEALQARLEDTAVRLSERLEAGSGRVADSLGALETRLCDQLAGFRADLAERMESRVEQVEAERAARAEAMAQDIQSVALGLSETDARLSEGFATLRLGLRALNDRVAELSAGAASVPPDEPAPAEAPADVTVLHPAPGDREGESLPQLRATLEAVLARLDGEGRRPPAEGAAAVWRRSSALRERPR